MRVRAGLLLLLLLHEETSVCMRTAHTKQQHVPAVFSSAVAMTAVACMCIATPVRLAAPSAVPNNNEQLWSSIWSEPEEGGLCTGLSQARAAGGHVLDD